MKNYKEKQVTIQEQTSVTCDVCGTEYSNILEIQEIVTISHECGFESIFGDNNVYSIDVCQHCMEQVFGNVINKHIKTTGAW